MAEEIVTEIIVSAEGAKKGIFDYTEALTFAGEATDKFGNKIAGSFSAAERAADAYSAKLDPAFAASQRLSKETTTVASAIDGLERQLMRGSITVEQYNQRMAQLAVKMLDLKVVTAGLSSGSLTAEAAMARLATATTSHATKIGTATDQSKRLGFALRDLSIQSQDFFVQIASGGRPLQAFIQQASQVAQVNQNMGVSFRQMASAIGSTIARLATNPWVLFAAAVTAVVGTVVGFAAANESAERRLLLTQTALRATREDYVAMGVAAEAAAKAVADQTGISRSDATAAARTIGGAQNFSGTQADLESLIKTAGDLAAVMGQKLPDAAKTLASAMDEPGKVAKELGEKHFPGMTNSLIETIRRMELAGDAAGGYARLMDVLRAAVDGAREQSLTPLQQLLETVGNTFSALGNTIADVINKAIAGLQRLFAEAAKKSPSTEDVEDALMGKRAVPEPAPGDRLRAAVPEYFQDLPENFPVPPIPKFGGSNANTINQAIGLANEAFSASKAGQIQNWRDKIDGAKKALSDLALTGVTTGAEVDRLNVGIKAYEKSIADASKGTAAHKTETEKLEEKLAKLLVKTNEQADAQDKLAEAHKAGGTEVVHLTAEAKAQADLISAGMLPSMAGWTEAVEKQTVVNERLARATGGAKIEESINKINQQTAAQLAINQAYDGTELSLTHATNAQKAYADAVAAGIPPGDKFNDVVARETQALDRAAAATQALTDRRQALTELSGMFTQAFNTISSAIVNAMFAGKDAVINFGQIAKAVAQQILSAFLQLAILNPLLNSLFGQRNLTIFSAIDALAGGAGGAGGGGGATDMLGNALMVGGVGNQLAGGGSMFGGVGSSVSGFLVGTAPSTNAALAGLGTGVYGPATAGEFAATGSSGIIGSGGAIAPALAAGGTIAGGVLGGFALGTMGGNMLAKSLNKAPGPNPMIGAGVGAGAGALIGTAIFPIIGTAIGALIGGIVGGLGGGSIGPRPASPFSSIGLSIGPGGSLQAGDLISQKTDAQALATNTYQNTQWLNAVMGAHGVSLSGLGTVGALGMNSPNGPQAAYKAADFATAFPQFRFDTAGPGGAAYTGRSFKDIQQLSDVSVAVEQFVATLQSTDAAGKISDFLNTLGGVATADIPAKLQDIVTFVTQTVPNLLNQGDNLGAYSAALSQVSQTYDPAIAKAHELGYKEAELTAVRDKATASVIANVAAQQKSLDEGIAARYNAAYVTVSGDTAFAKQAQFNAFDAQAQVQREQYSAQLLGIHGDAFKGSTDYANEMAFLERTLGEERLALAKQMDSQIVDSTQSTADAVVAAAKQIAEAQHQLRVSNTSLDVRYYQAQGIINPTGAKAASDYAFNVQQETERRDFAKNLIDTWGESLRATQDFADEMALLERTLSEERLANQKQFNDQMIQTASATITSLADYARGLQFSGASPLSPQAQYGAAQSEFNAVSGAAAAGDFASIQKLQQFSDSFLTASRGVYGSGAGYAADFQRVENALKSVGSLSQETLTASVYQFEMRSQTQQFVDSQKGLGDILKQILLAMEQGKGAPARAA